MMSLSRRQFLENLAVGAIASTSACNRTNAKRPNILFVMTDDHAVGRMSCEGSRILQTPNLDRLASEGTRFSNAFVTNSLCAPSRATVLTGCYSHRNGIKGNSEAKDSIETMNPAIRTYPEFLREAGYRTGIVGKWHLNQDPVGFEYSCILPGQGLYFDPDFIENGERRKMKGYATDITTDLALQFLANTQESQPFLLVYQHKAPHRPFLPAPRHARMFDGVDIPYPDTFDDDYSTRKIAREAEDMQFEISLAGDYKDLPKQLSRAERKRWIYQRFMKDYLAALYGVDENLGRVLKYLDDHNLAEDTLVIYTSDNGFFLGEHGWYDKRFMYEPSLRVPLLVRYPRLGVSGTTENRMAANIDLAPTILDFAGVSIPEYMQGRTLRPLIEGRPGIDWRKSVYYTYYENSWAALQGKGKEALTDPSFQYLTPHRVTPHRGVRTERYKLIEYYTDNYWEMFDLEKDPNELRNLYSDPAHSQVASDLQLELNRLRVQYQDT